MTLTLISAVRRAVQAVRGNLAMWMASAATGRSLEAPPIAVNGDSYTLGYSVGKVTSMAETIRKATHVAI
jgi:hypothetical protein